MIRVTAQKGGPALATQRFGHAGVVLDRRFVTGGHLPGLIEQPAVGGDEVSGRMIAGQHDTPQYVAGQRRRIERPDYNAAVTRGRDDE